MTVFVRATFITNLNKTKDFVALCDELVIKSREEEGCEQYLLGQDRHNPGRFTFIEVWSSQEELDRHSRSEHYQRIVPQLVALAEQEPEIIYLNQVL